MVKKPTQVRKKEIVASAQSFMMNKGIQNLTIKTIAELNHISEAAIYRHFENKHDVLAAVVDDIEEKLLQLMDQEAARFNDPFDKLKHIMRAHLLFTERRKGGLFVITAECIHSEDRLLRRHILKLVDKYQLRIQKILLQAGQQGMINPGVTIRHAAAMFYGLIQSAAIDFALNDYSQKPIVRFPTMWNLFKWGVQGGQRNFHQQE
jgi:AcrR family transcriptional regulator